MNHDVPGPSKNLPSYLAARKAVKALLESDAVYFGSAKIDAIVDSVIGALSEGMEPVATLEWSNGDPKHVLLTAAFSLPDGQYSLYPQIVPAHVAPASDDLIESIAKEWDGCTYEGVGVDVDIGQAIRDAARKYEAVSAVCAEPRPRLVFLGETEEDQPQGSPAKPTGARPLMVMHVRQTLSDLGSAPMSEPLKSSLKPGIEKDE